MSTAEYLEKLFADAFKREADQDEKPNGSEAPPPRPPSPPQSQFIIQGARLPWINEKKLRGSREPRK